MAAMASALPKTDGSVSFVSFQRDKERERCMEAQAPPGCRKSSAARNQVAVRKQSAKTTHHSNTSRRSTRWRAGRACLCPPASHQHPTGIPQLRRARDPSHTPVGDTSRHRQGCSRGKTRAQEQAKQERRSIRSNKLLNFHPCPKHLFVSASPGCGRWYKDV